jgi:hypothetical protein
MQGSFWCIAQQYAEISRQRSMVDDPCEGQRFETMLEQRLQDLGMELTRPARRE